MPKIYFSFLTLLFSLCDATTRVPNYNEDQLIPCLKKDDIEYNEHTKELRELYDEQRMYLFYRKVAEYKYEDYQKYQMMYCFGEYGLKNKEYSTYLNCMDKCKDSSNKDKNKCNCSRRRRRN